MSANLEIGSHTFNHSNLVELNNDQLMHEIAESKKIIKKIIGRKVYVFSYPHGNINNRLEKLLNDLGYEFAVTCKSGINKLDNFYALKRINIWDGTTHILNNKFSKGFFAFKMIGF